MVGHFLKINGLNFDTSKHFFLNLEIVEFFALVEAIGNQNMAASLRVLFK